MACRLPDSSRDNVLADMPARDANASSVQPRASRTALNRAPTSASSSRTARSSLGSKY